MKSIQNTYVNALLADAAYVEAIPVGEISVDRFKERLTLKQAQYLAANFEVVDSVETPRALGSGFDAIVWKIKPNSELSRPNNENAGKTYVSMRGTAGAEDLADDVLLASRGIPYQQIVDMVNWWLKATAAAGSTVKQIRFVEILNAYTFVEGTAYTATQKGVLADTTAIAGVNGHSLGGYLVTAFTRLFGSQAGVQSTSTYNSAGFANVAVANIEAEYNKIAGLLGLSGSFGAAGSIQTNYFALNGINFTTNSLGDLRLPGFNQYGVRVGLEQEEATGLDAATFANHSMYKLTDLLALGTVFEKLDPSLSINKLNTLVKASSNLPEASLEKLFDSVRRALAGRGITALPVTASATEPDPRSTFHDTLAGFAANLAIKQLQGQLLLRPTGLDLRAAARNDFGALVALQDLSGLWVTGKDAAANAQLAQVWSVSRPSDYAAWQADKSTATPITFTDNWIADRAAMLSVLVQRNELDNQGILPGTNNVRYFDAATSVQVLVGAGATNDQRIQYLFGGAGMDTYDLVAGELGDVIDDSDGNGTLRIGGQQLTGGTKEANNLWLSDDKRWGMRHRCSGTPCTNKKRGHYGLKMSASSYRKHSDLRRDCAAPLQTVVADRRGRAIFAGRLQLARTSIQVDSRLVPLSPGMNLTAEIKTGRRPVIDYLLSPIERASKESLRER